MLPKTARRFIAGEQLKAALQRTRLLNKRHVNVCISHLGEQLQSKKQVQSVVKEYEGFIAKIKTQHLGADPDVKLTNLGLCLSKSLCKRNLFRLSEAAKKAECRLWIDAEEYEYWHDTMDIFGATRKRFPHVCLTVQAYLKSSPVRDLLNAGAVLRLVKGCYKEKKSIIFTRKTEVRNSFRNLMKKLFTSHIPFAIGTHDQGLLAHARSLHKKYPSSFEFQFLMGLGYSLERSLCKENYAVAEYVPYGKDWQSYYHRRLDYLNSL